MTEQQHLRTTRCDYDTMAERYAEYVLGSLPAQPIDRSMITAFAELVREQGDRTVADIGCGPGHVTDHLDRLGLSVIGVDLSPAMVALARQARPDLSFVVGSMLSLDLADGSLGGILARYSIIHTPPPQVPAVFAEFSRVLAPGGYLLLSFQTGDGSLEEWQLFDHKVSPAYCWSIEAMAQHLGPAGLLEVARLRGVPGPEDRFHAGHLLARREQ